MSSTVQQTDPLSRLPVDVLTDSLLPSFRPRDIVALSTTCRQWYNFLTTQGDDCEVMWMRRCIKDFNFPVRASGRRMGWFQLYSRLAKSAAFIWGQNDNGRLALPDSTFRLPTSLRNRLIEGGLVLPTRLELPAPPVSIVAGGWSFHALTADGRVISWGILNGGNWARQDSPLYEDGRCLRPAVLPQNEKLGPISQLDAGRSHTAMLGQDGRVWEMRAYGRVVEIRDEAQRWGVAGSEVTSVYAGWDYSAVLTKAGGAFVWWQVAQGPLERGAKEAGEDELESPSTQGVAFPLEVDTLRLPHLSSTDEKITLLACGDNFVIALSDHSNLHFLDLSAVPDPARPHAPQGAINDPEDSSARSRESRARLDQEFMSGRRSWRLMKEFCDVEEIRKLDAFKEKGVSKTTKITHVSAHFNSFAAYSVPSSSDTTGSIVLLGSGDWHEQSEPEVIPELQDLGVIKIAHGDYHNLALTSSGQLYSWGAFSAGALGLGHPQLSNTPLSAPPPTPTSTPVAEEGVHPHRMPRALHPNQPLPAPTRQPHPMFPGFTAPRPAARVLRAPQRVDRPKRIRFDGDTEEGSSTFVYAVCASGWHSGALAVDLSTGATSASLQKEEEPIIRLKTSTTEQEEENQRVETENEGNGAGPTGGTWMGRLGRPFRVGFAGRGGTVNRGGAGGGVRPPSR